MPRPGPGIVPESQHARSFDACIPLDRERNTSRPLAQAEASLYPLSQTHMQFVRKAKAVKAKEPPGSG